jgi:hypothetical protein
MNRLLKPIIAPGIYPYKLVDPEDYRKDEFYIKLAYKVLKKCKEEKVIQKDNRVKVRAMK